MLRAEIAAESEYALEIEEAMKAGKLVPASVSVAVLKKRLAKPALAHDAVTSSPGKHAEGHHHHRHRRYFLLDGFPVDLENVQLFEKEIGEVDFALVLDCPKDFLRDRLKDRMKEEEAAIEHRLDVWDKQIASTIEYLEKKDKVRRVSTIPDAFNVYQEVQRIFGEMTLAIIKPDAVAAGHVDKVKALIKAHNFTIVAQSETTMTKEMAEELYDEHEGKPFFNELVAHMTSGPIVALCLQRVNAIKHWRTMMGPTDPAEAKKVDATSLRAKFGQSNLKNAVHGSESFEGAIHELFFFFPSLLSGDDDGDFA